MQHFTTIKDIARTLNISVSTVSRAIRDTYDVSPETKQKVMDLVRELNYKPNYNATGLAKGSTHNIGIILPFITNYYFSTVITGIQEVAYSKGFTIVLFVTNDSPETELSVIDNLFVSSLDGLLVCISSNSDSCDHFQGVIDNGIPVVFFDRVPSTIKTSKVMQDDFNGAYEAVEHLIENGYDKIAHIAGPKGLMFTERRLQGYIAALQKHDLPVREEWIIHSGFSQDFGEADTYRLLECEEKPNAIFAANDRKGIGAMLALKNKGIQVGKEVGVVGFTNDPMSAIISPSLTTVAEPAFDIGKESCELLLKHIKKKNFIPEEKILSGRLIVRESSRKS
ncbi:MAG: periplasmic binding protein/LacI transcriptional regulator [Segetibacter sp.]|nr:periplasmic binding protein/LacI transcriptional regulator [Segetibacter sp.]